MDELKKFIDSDMEAIAKEAGSKPAKPDPVSKAKDDYNKGKISMGQMDDVAIKEFENKQKAKANPQPAPAKPTQAQQLTEFVKDKVFTKENAEKIRNSKEDRTGGMTREEHRADIMRHGSWSPDAVEKYLDGIYGKEKKPTSTIDELNRRTNRSSEMGRLTQNAREKGQSPQQVLDSVAYDMGIEPNTDEYEELKEYALHDSRLNKETGQYEYNKYNTGSNKQLSDPKDRAKMQELVEGLKKAGLKNVKLYDGYEDYGANMKWTAPVADDTWVLSPRQWIDYMNGNASVDEIVKQVKNGEYSNVFEWAKPTQPKLPTFEKGVAGKDYEFNDEGSFSTKSRRVPHSSFEEPSIAYEDLSRFYGIDLEELMYGSNGFYDQKYKGSNIEPLYDQKAWGEFEDWIKEKYGVSLDDIRKANREEYGKLKKEEESKYKEVNVPYLEGVKGKLIGNYPNVVEIEYTSPKTGVTRKERFYRDEFEEANKDLSDQYVNKDVEHDEDYERSRGSEDIDISDDDIREQLGDYTWSVTDKTTAGQYAQECADRLGTTKERVFEIIKQQAPTQITENSNMSRIIDAYENEYEYKDEGYTPEEDEEHQLAKQLVSELKIPTDEIYSILKETSPAGKKKLVDWLLKTKRM